MKTKIISDIGNTVICDCCNADWTGRPESGGFLFGSYAYCPDCAVKRMPSIIGCNEQGNIRAHCPKDKSFAAWVLELRGGDNTVKEITYDSAEEMFEHLKKTSLFYGGVWECACGAKFDFYNSVDRNNSDWRWNGHEWEHYHGIPCHNGIAKKLSPPA